MTSTSTPRFSTPHTKPRRIFDSVILGCSLAAPLMYGLASDLEIQKSIGYALSPTYIPKPELTEAQAAASLNKICLDTSGGYIGSTLAEICSPTPENIAREQLRDLEVHRLRFESEYVNPKAEVLRGTAIGLFCLLLLVSVGRLLSNSYLRFVKKSVLTIVSVKGRKTTTQGRQQRPVLRNGAVLPRAVVDLRTCPVFVANKTSPLWEQCAFSVSLLPYRMRRADRPWRACIQLHLGERRAEHRAPGQSPCPGRASRSLRAASVLLRLRPRHLRGL